MDNSEYKNCPYCDEKIKVKAIKCRYCHSFFEEKLDNKTIKEEIEKMDPAEQIISSLENIYNDLKLNNSGRDEHWLLANTWLKKYGDTKSAKQKGLEVTKFIAYKDTLNFSVLEPPESIRGLALYLVYKELGEDYAKDYVEEFNPIMEKVMKYKNENIYFVRYKEINQRTWKENQEKTSTQYSIYWLLNVLEKPPSVKEEQLFRERFELKTCPSCSKIIPFKAIKCKYCESFSGESKDVVIPDSNNILKGNEYKNDIKIHEINQVRPWVRYVARMTDIYIFSMVFLITLIFIYPDFLLSIFEFGIFATALILFLWIFLEALFLSSLGTTPGKFLLSTYVRDIRGSNLTYSNAFSRSFQVFMKGLGFGIVPINIITMIIAYRALIVNPFGLTTWDQEGEYRVRHEPIRPFRVVILVIIWFGILWLNAF